jgi:hypothetical protein
MLTYKYSVDRYAVTLNKGYEDETTITIWASPLGLKEWIAKQPKHLLLDTEYEIIEKGIVQEGQPVIKFNAAGERIDN